MAGVLWTAILSSVGGKVQSDSAATAIELASGTSNDFEVREKPAPTVNEISDAVLLGDVTGVVASVVANATDTISPVTATATATVALGLAVAASGGDGGVSSSGGLHAVKVVVDLGIAAQKAGEVASLAAVLGGTAELVTSSADEIVMPENKKDVTAVVGLVDEGLGEDENDI